MSDNGMRESIESLQSTVNNLNMVIEYANKMIQNLSMEVQALQNENSALKEEMMALRVSNAISRGVTVSLATQKYIEPINMNSEKVAISHFDTLANTFGNTLDESNDMNRQR